MKIRILLAGGTIDKRYNELNGELDFTKSHVETMLKQSRAELDITIEQVLMIDSLDMKDEDRQAILKACREAPEDKIVITHGTDTMPETAKVLGSALKNKTVVLLGAMVPFSFGESDALFNLGTAMIGVQLLEHGVYITMNGKVFKWDNVRKNLQLGIFETINP